jgi:hypothetical protein
LLSPRLWRLGGEEEGVWRRHLPCSERAVACSIGEADVPCSDPSCARLRRRGRARRKGPSGLPTILAFSKTGPGRNPVEESRSSLTHPSATAAAGGRLTSYLLRPCTRVTQIRRALGYGGAVEPEGRVHLGCPRFLLSPRQALRRREPLIPDAPVCDGGCRRSLDKLPPPAVHAGHTSILPTRARTVRDSTTRTSEVSVDGLVV